MLSFDDHLKIEACLEFKSTTSVHVAGLSFKLLRLLGHYFFMSQRQLKSAIPLRLLVFERDISFLEFAAL